MFSVVGKNVVINSNKDSVIIRRRKIHSETEYKEWDGQEWSVIPADSHFFCEKDFTDYNLDDGIYVYRFSDDGENCEIVYVPLSKAIKQKKDVNDDKWAAMQVLSI